jgi:hypothetical protein
MWNKHNSAEAPIDNHWEQENVDAALLFAHYFWQVLGNNILQSTVSVIFWLLGLRRRTFSVIQYLRFRVMLGPFFSWKLFFALWTQVYNFRIVQAYYCTFLFESLSRGGFWVLFQRSFCIAMLKLALCFFDFLFVVSRLLHAQTRCHRRVQHYNCGS